ncbi:MAG TPA: calcium-binding protein [Actinomycetota bacterium]|nr:calcium-binding protein [Actinomycetota bacterium]
MRARVSVPRAAAAALGLALLALGLTGPVAFAAATCSFAGGTVTVTLTDGATATLVRQGDAIALDGSPCDTASVNDTDDVIVTGSASNPDDFTIDLSGGAFAPGQTDEDGDSDEIEFAVDLPAGGTLRISGREDGDRLTVGSDGANLNVGEATNDVDVVLDGPARWELAGVTGDDRLSIAGGDGTGAAVVDATVRGGSGSDTIVAALDGCVIAGEGDVDTLDYSAAPTGVRVDLSKGQATRTNVDPDTVTGIENVVGTPQDDRLTGDEQSNELLGGAGRDTLDGHKGADDLVGGEGKDTVAFAYATVSVTVDLKEGTSTGNGSDTLTSIESVRGSKQADVISGGPDANALRGGPGGDAIRGNAGRDLVVGGKGWDVLLGGEDRDRVEGGRGKDQLNGGDGRDTCVPGPDPDSWTACEVVKL